MISEIPVTQEEAELEPEPLEPPPPPSPPKKEPQPEKRRPGRPRKEPKEQPKENVPPPEAKPKAKPKTRAKVKDEPFKTLQEAPSFTINDLSNAQLMAELVNRRRTTDREMKANLYRSFVM